MSEVGNLIREARHAARLSQVELARRAETSQPALARYESGEVLPTLPTLERILAACGRRLELRAVRARDSGAASTSLRGQVGARARDLRRRRPALLEAARAHGVRRVRVFGSVARGEADSGSDVDLLVDLAPGRTLVDLAGFRADAARILGGEVDVATADMLKPRVRRDAEAEALPL